MVTTFIIYCVYKWLEIIKLVKLVTLNYFLGEDGPSTSGDSFGKITSVKLGIPVKRVKQSLTYPAKQVVHVFITDVNNNSVISVYIYSMCISLDI